MVPPLGKPTTKNDNSSEAHLAMHPEDLQLEEFFTIYIGSRRTVIMRKKQIQRYTGSSLSPRPSHSRH
jgi:hypothetical protein